MSNQKIISSGEYTFILEKNNENIKMISGMGVKPFMQVIGEDSTLITGANVYDKVIGKAAAMLCVKYGAVEVYGECMSVSGFDFLTAHGITATYGQLVPFISNRTGDGMCPLENSVIDITDPAEGEDKIRATIKILMAKKDYVIIAGSVTYDITVTATQNLKWGDKNAYNTFEYCAGGVALNIGRNLSKLGVNAKMLCAVGDDNNGNAIIADGKNAGLDMSDVKKAPDHPTCTFVAVNDPEGELILGVADMSTSELCSNKEYFIDKKDVISGAKLAFVGPCIMEESIKYFSENFADIPKFVDMESSDYTDKFMGMISTVHTLKVNTAELASLTKLPVDTLEEIEAGCDWAISRGVGRIFVTMGAKGVFYKDNTGFKIYREAKKLDNIKSSNGAGDAFMSGVIYSFLNGFDIDKTIDFAMAAANATLASVETINPELSADMVIGLMGR